MASTRGEWVRLLSVPGDPVAAVSFPETVTAAVAQIGQDAVSWAARVGHDLALRGLTGLPSLTTSEHDVDLVRTAGEPAVLAILRGIEAGRVESIPIGDEIRLVLREYVRRHVPLDAVWASILAGHGWLSEQLVAACRELVDPVDLGPQLELISKVIFGYLNPLSAGVGEVYAHEQRAWSRSADRARDLLVRAVVSGERTDADAVSEALRYRITNRSHVGLVLWRERLSTDDPADLTGFAGELLAELGATNAFVLPVGNSQVWAWGSLTGPFAQTDRWRAATARAVLLGAWVAAGASAVGLDGFRRTHHQARRAARSSRLLGGRAQRLTAFADVSLVSLLSADLQQAREFAEEELGVLAGLDQASRDLRETVLTYLQCHRSPQMAAQKLFVSRNTVTYRVKRAEALLGRPLTLRESELRAALLMADLVLR